MAARTHPWPLWPLLTALVAVGGALLWWSLAPSGGPIPAPVDGPGDAGDARAPGARALEADDADGSTPAPVVSEAATTPSQEPVPKDSHDQDTDDAAVADAGSLMLLYDDLVVLAVAPDPAWGAPPIASERFGERLIVRERVPEERLPAGLRGLVGADLVVYDGDGEPCLTTLTGVDLYAEAREAGEGREDADEERDDADLRARSRRLLARPLLLVAEQDPQRLCPGLWARRADLPPARVFTREALEGDAREALRAPLTALAAAELAALRARVGDDAAALTPRIVRFRERAGPRELYSVELGEAADPCDEADAPAPVGFLAERQGDRWVRLAAPAAVGVEAIVDLDRDGHLALVSQSGGRWALVVAGPRAEARRLAFELPAPACTI